MCEKEREREIVTETEVKREKVRERETETGVEKLPLMFVTPLVTRQGSTFFAGTSPQLTLVMCPTTTDSISRIINLIMIIIITSVIIRVFVIIDTQH